MFDGNLKIQKISIVGYQQYKFRSEYLLLEYVISILDIDKDSETKER